ncbi:MAG: hypothetical protein AAF938_16935, partial [Myxococcota bacterium]
FPSDAKLSHGPPAEPTLLEAKTPAQRSAEGHGAAAGADPLELSVPGFQWISTGGGAVALGASLRGGLRF